MVKLSILDQSTLSDHENPRQAIENTIKLGKLADSLGYTRFWVTEHHNTRLFASASPEILLARLGAETSRIRLGSGGVMLSNHSPFRIAENFRMLEAMYPGRIDCGVGRAAGADTYSKRLLNPDSDKADFEDLLVRLENYLNDRDPNALAQPIVDEVPLIWMLTAASSAYSGSLAAKLGYGLVAGLMINPNASPRAVRCYRHDFRPSLDFEKPYVILAVNCLYGETPQELERLKKISDLVMLGRDSGNFLTGLPSDAALEKVAISPVQREYLDSFRDYEAAGDLDEITAFIDRVAEKFTADEIMLTFYTSHYEQRERAMRALAERYSLS